MESKYGPLCSHISLTDHVRVNVEIEDLMTDEAMQRLGEKIEKMKSDGKSRAQLASDQERLERAKARVDWRHRCVPCNHNAPSQSSLGRHKQTKTHYDAVYSAEHGMPNGMPVTDAAIKAKELIASNLAGKRFYCKLCDSNQSTAANYAKHILTTRHLAALEQWEKAGKEVTDAMRYPPVKVGKAPSKTKKAQRHRKAKGKAINEGKNRCGVCDQSFTYNSSLRNHFKSKKHKKALASAGEQTENGCQR